MKPSPLSTASTSVSNASRWAREENANAVSGVSAKGVAFSPKWVKYIGAPLQFGGFGGGAHPLQRAVAQRIELGLRLHHGGFHQDHQLLLVKGMLAGAEQPSQPGQVGRSRNPAARVRPVGDHQPADRDDVA